MKAVFVAGDLQNFEDALEEISGVLSTRIVPTGQGGCPNEAGSRQGGSGRESLAVEVDYDPDSVTFEKLLELFWSSHDPQAPERSSSSPSDPHRSLVLYSNDDQRIRAIMAKIKLERSGRFRRPVVTAILPAAEFSPLAQASRTRLGLWRTPLSRDPEHRTSRGPISDDHRLMP